MTKTQLINKLKTKFTLVGPEKQGSSVELSGETITHWSIPTFDMVGDILIEQWILFYTDETGNAYWQNREPKSDPVPFEPSFIDKVNSFIKAKIDDGTIKFGHIEQYQEKAKKALVKAIDSGGVEKQAIITEDEAGDFSIDIL